MATLKIIADKSCKLFIDQEFVCDLTANKLVKHEIEPGIYLVDVIANEELQSAIKESFDLEINEPKQQILKRIVFAFATNEQIVNNDKEYSNDDFSNNPDLIFFNGYARVQKNGKYGFINKSFKWTIEPQFDEAETLQYGISLVSKSFGTEKKYTILDSKCSLPLGFWFDNVMFRTDSFFVVQRKDELLKIDISSMVVSYTWHLEGKLFEDRPIAVSISNGITKQFGYIDITGNVVLPFIYDYVSDFSDSGWAEVERFGIRRFINKEGNVNVLNTLEDIEAKTKQYYILDNYYEWCGSLEYPEKDHLFLGGVYRFSIRKNGKWGYACLKEERYNGPNTIKMMLDFKYELFLSDSRFGYVIAKDGEYLSVINLIGAKYARGEKEGQYVYDAMGENLFKMKCQEMYPLNEYSYEWVDYGGSGWYEYKSTFNNIVVKTNNKYGIVDLKGHYVLEPLYDDIYFQKIDGEPHKWFDKKIIIIEKNHLKGLVSTDGNIIIDAEYSEIYAIGDMWSVKTGIDFQLFDVKEMILLPPHFDSIKLYEEKQYVETNVVRDSYLCYLITKDNKMGCISADGDVVVDCEYDIIEILSEIDLSCTKLKVTKKGNVGLLSNKGSKIIPCDYEDIIPIDGDYKNNPILYLVKKNGYFSFWSLEGQQLTDFLYEDAIYISSDNDEQYNCWNLLMAKRNGKYALIKDDFSTLTDYVYEEYEVHWINSFGTVIFARMGKFMGCINLKGSVLIDFDYDDLQFLASYNSPRIKVKKNNKVGVISLEDYYDIECIYDDICLLSGNYHVAYIASNNKIKKLLDIRGNIIISDYMYDDSKVFYNNKDIIGVSVKHNELWGFVNSKGKELIRCEYEDIVPCDIEGEIVAYIITKGRKVGAISPTSEVLIDIIYDNIDFEKTDKNYFFCYNTGDSWSGNPRKALLFGSSQEIQLKSIRPYDCIKELKELGY